MLREIVLKNRSYRRFFEDERIDTKTLEELIDLARLTASAMNSQPIKYILVNGPERNDLVFPNLKWAGYLKEWAGPEKGERPAAYIIALWDKSVHNSRELALCDLGIVSQTILLGAAEKGLGGCMIWAFDRKEVTKIFDLSDRYEPLLVIALGKPKEKVVIEEIEKDGDIKYWRDANQVHHVPKRRLEDIIIK